MHAHAQALDLRLERQPAEVIQLHRHQARRELHHMGFKAQAFQGVGGFQAEQATADHHTTPRIRGGATDGIEVFKGTVDQPRIALRAVDRRHKRVRAGCQDQFVIRHAACGGDHLTAGAVDFQYRRPQVQGHARRLVQRSVRQRQRLGITASEVFGQMHAVIGTHRLFAEHMQAIVLQRAALDQLRHTMMADHAIADDDQGFQLFQTGESGIHIKHPTKLITV